MQKKNPYNTIDCIGVALRLPFLYTHRQPHMLDASPERKRTVIFHSHHLPRTPGLRLPSPAGGYQATVAVSSFYHVLHPPPHPLHAPRGSLFLSPQFVYVCDLVAFIFLPNADRVRALIRSVSFPRRYFISYFLRLKIPSLPSPPTPRLRSNQFLSVPRDHQHLRKVSFLFSFFIFILFFGSPAHKKKVLCPSIFIYSVALANSSAASGRVSLLAHHFRPPSGTRFSFAAPWCGRFRRFFFSYSAHVCECETFNYL